MREKWKDSRGETLVEVLASIVVCSLSVLLLFGAVAASANIDRKAQTADEDYYNDLRKAERQGSGDQYTPSTIIAVKVSKVVTPPPPGTTVEDIVKVTFYGSERLLSYAFGMAPAGPDPVPGG